MGIWEPAERMADLSGQGVLPRTLTLPTGPHKTRGAGTLQIAMTSSGGKPLKQTDE
ncbi:hypothetical protein JAN5088_02150 [Jannaschia rubra]|uniref:Uncharacterized protein n=1 Tax=Jannaschia rubra TaxID=282197 RepID=A0A0M6XR70_9RHOB|nr:hypothetical protein JAN5088_02150 [Jannaschia rubra]SFG00131.1 hypothetical protein SAMN04488517_102196 [Jannaschia rubra]